MAHVSRFKLRDSDRDGFTRKEQSLVKDAPWKVGPDEYDTAPPSRKSLGGEGDVNKNDILSSNTFEIGDVATPSAYDNPVNYITAAGGITPSFVHPWMFVVGSNANVTLSANPQIAAGVEGKKLTVYGVGSTIRIIHGNGVVMVGSQPCVVDSGQLISFLYTASNGTAAWRETSRSHV